MTAYMHPVLSLPLVHSVPLEDLFLSLVKAATCYRQGDICLLRPPCDDFMLAGRCGHLVQLPRERGLLHTYRHPLDEAYPFKEVATG